jgi:hypothetical protein
MKHLTATASAAAAWLALAVPAWAQQPGFPYQRPQTNPYGTPTVSPFVNLNRFGNPGVTYYGIVRPQLNTNANLIQLQQQQGYLAEQQALGIQGADPNLPTTGHPTQFFNYSHYFSNQSGRLASTPTAGTAQAQVPAVLAPRTAAMTARTPPLPVRP